MTTPAEPVAVNRDDLIAFLITKAEKELSRANDLQKVVEKQWERIKKLESDLEDATAPRTALLDAKMQEQVALLGFPGAQ